MKRFRFALMCLMIFQMTYITACSDDSDDEEAANTTPFAFLSGNYGVGVSPRIATCENEVFFPQEMWVVYNYLDAVIVMPIPDTTASPEPATTTSEPVTDTARMASLQDDASAEQAASIPSYSGGIDSTLHWSASMDSESVLESGCLKRSTTLLDIQFTSDGNFAGTRSIIHDYAGGADCPVSCRLLFDVQGAMLPE